MSATVGAALELARESRSIAIFLFAFLRLTILGFHGGFPDHLVIPDAAYRPPWLLATKEKPSA